MLMGGGAVLLHRITQMVKILAALSEKESFLGHYKLEKNTEI